MELKKIASGLTLLALSSTTFASIMPGAWVKEDEAIYQLRFEGQYDEQSTNLKEPGATIADFPVTIPSSDFPNADRAWGYNGNLVYIFPQHKYDIRGNYTWLRSDQDIPVTGHSGGLNATGSEKRKYDFDGADLTAGQIFKAGKQMLYRIGVGLGYANIHQSDNAIVAFTNSPATQVQTFNNEFKGFGPKVTAAGQYNVSRYLAVVANLGLSGLYGNSKATRVATVSGCPGEDCSLPVNQKIQDDKITIGIDGKFGGEFTYALKETTLGIEVGYQFTSYLDAMEDLNTATTIPDAELTQLYDSRTDYFNSGLYVNVALSFMPS